MADKVIAIFAAKENFIDDIDLENVIEFRNGLTASMQTGYDELRDKIRAGILDDEVSDELKGIIAEYKEDFLTLHPNKAQLDVEATAEETVEADEQA